MTQFLKITCLCLLACVCNGSELFLKSESTGRLYGPFEMRDGEKVQIGKSAFVVVEKQAPQTIPKAATMEGELKAIRLAQVDFRNASAEDCTAFIQQQVSSLRPELGLSIAVKRPKSFRVIDVDRMDPFSEPSRPGGNQRQDRVTLKEMNGSVFGVLNEVAEQSGFQIRYSGRRITLIQ